MQFDDLQLRSFEHTEEKFRTDSWTEAIEQQKEPTDCAANPLIPYNISGWAFLMPRDRIECA